MRVAYAEVMQMAQVTLNLSFAVHVISPIEMPPRVYSISYQEMIVRETAFKNYKQVVYELLSEKVLADYNRLLEDCPIMDMFSDPDQYKRCTSLEWIFIDPDGSKTTKLIS